MNYPDLTSAAKRRDGEALSRLLGEMHPADIADFLDTLPSGDETFVFSLLSDPVAAEVLDEVEPETTQTLVDDCGSDRLARILEHLETDDAAEIVDELKGEESAQILAQVEDAAATRIADALTYDRNSVGRLMTDAFVALEQTMTAETALASVRTQVAGVDEIFYVYVVDRTGGLVGVLSMRALVLAREHDAIGDICDRSVVQVVADADREEVARTMAKYDLLAVPVVDHAGTLIGTVTVDDALDVLEEEASEDLLRISGSFEPVRERPRRVARVFYRLPWLLVTVAGELAVAFLLSGFIDQLERVIALALFIPIVSATAGSVGIQSLAASLTSTSQGKAVRRPILTVAREARSGLILGVMSGAIAGGLAVLWKWDVMLGVAIASSMAVSLMAAALIGAAVPLALNKLRIDPTVASGPLITTLSDALSLTIYLSIAGFLLASA